MPRTKTTGEQLADQIRWDEYDPSFLIGFLTSFVGSVADGETLHSPRQAARDVLESLADFDAFVAEIPIAKGRQS